MARSQASIPDPDALPGGCRYEPKWDGYRATVTSGELGVRIWSRRGTDMTEAFPELTAAAAQLPEGTVLDGEVVAWVGGRLDFDALQQRLSAGKKRRRALARDLQASLVLFDVLALAGEDVRVRPFDERRHMLEQLAASWRPPLTLSPMTVDVAEARGWFEDMAAAGIEGLVVKGAQQAYKPGERQWIKVKYRNITDVIVGAVIGPIERPKAVVVGNYVDGELRIVGRSTPLKPSVARSLGALLRPPIGEHPWPEFVSPGAVDRFNAGNDPVRLTLVDPVPAEISADVAQSHGVYRHGVRFVRLVTEPRS
ncbi:ATP-dependent DNA ligase [Micromonospora sp. DT81.3]|uniref:ATP-dependent DNA ligase n=1 Tax=Micromonospora sp. DT81.3 TaxID=3416523 RepID=UPI003CF66894